jgi:hypothetical protein
MKALVMAIYASRSNPTLYIAALLKTCLPTFFLDIVLPFLGTGSKD